MRMFYSRIRCQTTVRAEQRVNIQRLSDHDEQSEIDEGTLVPYKLASSPSQHLPQLKAHISGCSSNSTVEIWLDRPSPCCKLMNFLSEPYGINSITITPSQRASAKAKRS